MFYFWGGGQEEINDVPVSRRRFEDFPVPIPCKYVENVSYVIRFKGLSYFWKNATSIMLEVLPYCEMSELCMKLNARDAFSESFYSLSLCCRVSE